jgi:small subunit ribosomal protein S12
MITFNQLVAKSKSRTSKIAKGTRSRALERCPHKKGVCYKVTTMKPKKPNSAIRKIAKVRLSTKRKVICYIPGRGHELREYSQVLVRGGHVPDLPGIQYHLVKGKYDFSWKEAVPRKNRRSKYGIPRDQTQTFYK